MKSCINKKFEISHTVYLHFFTGLPGCVLQNSHFTSLTFYINHIQNNSINRHKYKVAIFFLCLRYNKRKDIL